ncbi:hypothetical protein HHI36_019675 [Cryptolaemus montrouzieri]|uniref:Coiled-coil domain-containing protein 86 n=1 Tax=Cryptolaemus montrouzieri TaxID=559131 RepID=A0ABD2N895_9CUCU
MERPFPIDRNGAAPRPVYLRVPVGTRSLKTEKGVGAGVYSLPWWNEDCTAAINRRKQALKNFRKQKSMENLIEMKRQKAIIKRTLKPARKESWQTHVSTISTSTQPTEVGTRLKKSKAIKPRSKSRD